LFALIAAPWFVAVCLRNPGLFTQLVVYETWQRVTTTVHGRIGPWYYFIGVFSVGFFPWIFLVPAAVRERWAAIRDARNGYESLCFCWFAVPFVAFSASKSKLIAYILPVFPAAALLLARWIDRALENDEVPRTATRTTLVGALLSLAGIAWVLHVDRPAALEGVATHVMFFYPVLGLLVMAADRAERKGRLRPLLAAMAVVSLVFPALVAPFADEAEGDFKMMRPLAMAIRKLAKPGAPVVLCGFGATSIPFYIERSVCTFECASDLHYEKNRAELAKQHFEDMGRLVEMLEQGPVYLVADDEMRQRIDRAQWPRTHRRLRILATERRYMLLADPDR
ncbi:MAG: hypothetical protein HY303_17240, partial [Candidatus Wallbacteria bacterium]|nr:hypothetical protein [Candidatus Wallbacteria bacterium]